MFQSARSNETEWGQLLNKIIGKRKRSLIHILSLWHKKSEMFHLSLAALYYMRLMLFVVLQNLSDVRQHNANASFYIFWWLISQAIDITQKSIQMSVIDFCARRYRRYLLTYRLFFVVASHIFYWFSYSYLSVLAVQISFVIFSNLLCSIPSITCFL